LPPPYGLKIIAFDDLIALWRIWWQATSPEAVASAADTFPNGF
jgi:hypothetical protein